MGRKYIIEIGRLERLYKAFIGAHGKPDITWLSPEVDLTPYTEPNMEQVRKEAYDKAFEDAEQVAESGKRAMYQKGLADAWEAARKIYGSATKHGLPTETITKIFRDDGKEYFNYWDIVEDFSPAEAIEKIRQYEQEKEEQIQVGDEVTTDSGKAVVTGVGPVHFEYVYADGSHGYDEVKNVKKTGRHFPEVAAVLEKMRESE